MKEATDLGASLIQNQDLIKIVGLACCALKIVPFLEITPPERWLMK